MQLFVLQAAAVYNNYSSAFNSSCIALSSGPDTSFTDIICGVSSMSKSSASLLFVDNGITDTNENSVVAVKNAVKGKTRDNIYVFGGP